MSDTAPAAGYFHDFLKFRLLPNAPSHRGPTCTPVGPGDARYELAIVEFDDQGSCFDRRSLGDLEQSLRTLDGASPIILVFVHGWKHNATGHDDNLLSIRALLADTAAKEAQPGGTGRPVLGVFVSWRGLSRSGNWIWTQSSFWDRQDAAQRVALGSTRELLGRLKAFRNGAPGDKPHATLVIIGHSFGGLIVYAAIAQSLIEAAATQGHVVPSFGDLVVLVNPAFAAVSYLPIHEIVTSREFDPNQLPVCISVTALNDMATKLLYPLGSRPKLLSEAWRGPQEREALINTMGHIPWMRTHELTIASPSPMPQAPAASPAGRARDHSTAVDLTSATTPRTLGGVMVTPVPGRRPNPFWVASATKSIINGHNGIFTEPFENFIRALVGAHLQEAAGRIA
jgi:hypothetical protein